jgi:phosphatidyl-myo-inositol alpha-mannosyltransferase
MRIALVTEFYHPHLGGVTEHVENLALQFRRRGHEVTIITARMAGQGIDPEHVCRVGTSRVVFSNGSFARVTTGFGLRHRIASILRERQIDIVHLHGALAPTLGLVAQDAAEEIGVPVVATFHSWFRRSIACRIFRPTLQARLHRIAASIAVSEPVIAALSRYFTTDWTIIPNGIDIDHFRPVPHDGNGARHPPRLLFLGRLDPRNGLGTMLDAMPSILRRRPDARLVVAGDGPLRGYYEERARPLGDRVHFLGKVNGERPHLYGTSDLYLCPTSKASFGITLLEAMACATPIVGSDIIGFRELIARGAEAVLVPVNDADAWAETAVALLDNPERRHEMGAAGRAKAEQYAWPQVADQVFAVYTRVLG